MVPLSDVLVDDELEAAVRDVLRSGWWSMGPKVQEFEEKFAAYCGSRHAVAVANGTAALHLALLASGCGQGDEVILPSLNFVAAANAIGHAGARPVFCDIVSPEDLNLDPADVEAAIGPATRAILLLHYGGFPCDIEAVLAIARQRDLIVIEDAAHALGASSGSRMCGSFGHFGCFSFFANKNLPVGEGGMMVTDDDELASRARLLRSHGMTTLTWARHRGHAHTYDVVARGFNYRLDEHHAALGLVQLGRLPQMNEARSRIVARYRKGFAATDRMAMPFADRGSGKTTSAHHLAVVVFDDAGLRSHVRESLAARRIQTSAHYPPIHRFTEWADEAVRSLPVTDAVRDRILTLPLYPHMRDEQVEFVIQSVVDALDSTERQSA